MQGGCKLSLREAGLHACRYYVIGLNTVLGAMPAHFDVTDSLQQFFADVAMRVTC
jgi:hypothetical protein